MIKDYKNNEGFVVGYIGWNVMDENWKYCNDGNIIEIDGCWIHESRRNSDLLITMINDVFLHPTTQNVEYVVYIKDKTGEQRLTPASKFLQFIKKGDNNE